MILSAFDSPFQLSETRLQLDYIGKVQYTEQRLSNGIVPHVPLQSAFFTFIMLDIMFTFSEAEADAFLLYLYGAINDEFMIQGP